MNMISADDAREIANEYLLKLELEDGGESLQLVEKETLEKPFGWVFFYNSKDYLETGEFKFRLAGNAPFIVDKNNGDVHVTGTAKPIEGYISDFERQYTK